MVLHFKAGIARMAAAVCILGVIFSPGPSRASEESDLLKTADSINAGALPAYASAKLQELTRNLRIFQQQTLTTYSEEETLHELIRILNTTTKTYQALNYYVYGWNTTMEYQYRFNIEAVKRGVDVSRTFIITDQTLHDSEKLHTLLEVMETQKKDGIKIFYGLQAELEKEPDYHRFALMDVGLSDDAVLARVTAVSVKGPQPARIKITWNRKRVQELNPFPYLRRSPHIYSYDQAARAKLIRLIKNQDGS